MLTDNDLNSLKDEIIRAEVLHKNSVVQNMFPFLTAEHLSTLYTQTFLDLKIAEKVKCSTLKKNYYTGWGDETIAESSLVDYMKEEPSSLVNDGNTDTDVKKINALC